jgi:predicted anti-sigma-YlaC factor YlaD
MECPDVRQLADTFVDGELRTETNHLVYHHLERCLACRVDIKSRRALRARLQGALLHAPSLGSRPVFVSELRTRLQADSQRVHLPRAVRIPRWLALAAVLGLTAVLGVVFRPEWFPPARTLVRAAVGDAHCSSG